ncbi:MAG: hypothetical protein MI867_22000 [Pseudomonadales bacterium]|nr:hypothetical protein [Pseudomonadales bacterium]
MEEIVEFIFKGLFRFIVYVLKEIAFELAIKGPGYIIVRSYRNKKDVDPDGWEVTLWGLAFWGLAVACFVLFL